jgi:hypothetical protein
MAPPRFFLDDVTAGGRKALRKSHEVYVYRVHRKVIVFSRPHLFMFTDSLTVQWLASYPRLDNDRPSPSLKLVLPVEDYSLNDDQVGD